MSSAKNQSSSQPRKNQGRRKVNMAKMEKEANLQVTFSKRRAGLFKKARNKAHSFGHPDINAIADRFLNDQDNAPPVINRVANRGMIHAGQDKADVEYLARLEKMVKAAKARKNERDQKEKLILSSAAMDKLSYEQLVSLKERLMEAAENLKTLVEHGAVKVKPPMMGYDFISGSGGGLPLVGGSGIPGFDVSSSGGMVKHGVGHDNVIPYDEGANETGEAD
ncbi:hypothetical protein DH2020_003076 [Rehmannia glutinosa]|uniref:MADS-box domain-containing protein n=1 Tax=Rehmannia glutinosa TaxID=99300 RepID=A0ABR0XKR0_REHGL